jgi:Domain of unknown function(DUF2779)
MARLISKTDYMRWQECPKDAWLAIHKPDLYYSLPLSDFEIALEETGEQVERIARELFSNGVLVEGRDKSAQELTQRLIDAKTPTIFQPVFTKDGFIAIADVLTFDKATETYTIHEIKSSSDVKDEYLTDIAFQVLVLRRCGLKVKEAFLIHLNPDYVRHGDLELHNLFVSSDMSIQMGEVEKTILEKMEAAKAFLVTDVEPAGPCGCIYKGRSRHCTTFSYSNPHVPKYGVHDISRIGSSEKKLRAMVDANVFELDKIPTHIELSKAQQNQVNAYKSGEILIDKAAIATAFSGLQFPLHFIDYETHLAAIPLFDGWSPNKQMQFQYSLHILEAPGKEIIHKEFLHTALQDPDIPFSKSLQEHIGPSGSIIVWHKAFECSIVNKPLALRHPEFAEFFADFESRVYDLEGIFTKQHYVHSGFLGKTSIKNVLPVMVPELSHENLEIHEGATASAAWPKLVSGELDEVEAKRICDALREYCGLDSYAMCAIFLKLQEAIVV